MQKNTLNVNHEWSRRLLPQTYKDLNCLVAWTENTFVKASSQTMKLPYRLDQTNAQCPCLLIPARRNGGAYGSLSNICREISENTRAWSLREILLRANTFLHVVQVDWLDKWHLPCTKEDVAALVLNRFSNVPSISNLFLVQYTNILCPLCVPEKKFFSTSGNFLPKPKNVFFFFLQQDGF